MTIYAYESELANVMIMCRYYLGVTNNNDNEKKKKTIKQNLFP